MRPARPGSSSTLPAVLGAASLGGVALALALATPARLLTASAPDTGSSSDLTDPVPVVSAVSVGGGFFGHCSSGDSCQGPTAHAVRLRAPATSEGTAVLTVSFDYRTRGAGRFGVQVREPRGSTATVDVRPLRPSLGTWQTGTIQVVLRGLPLGEVTTTGLSASVAPTSTSRGAQLEVRRLVVRADYW